MVTPLDTFRPLDGSGFRRFLGSSQIFSRRAVLRVGIWGKAWSLISPIVYSLVPGFGVGRGENGTGGEGSGNGLIAFSLNGQFAEAVIAKRFMHVQGFLQHLVSIMLSRVSCSF